MRIVTDIWLSSMSGPTIKYMNYFVRRPYAVANNGFWPTMRLQLTVILHIGALVRVTHFSIKLWFATDHALTGYSDPTHWCSCARGVLQQEMEDCAAGRGGSNGQWALLSLPPKSWCPSTMHALNPKSEICEMEVLARRDREQCRTVWSNKVALIFVCLNARSTSSKPHAHPTQHERLSRRWKKKTDSCEPLVACSCLLLAHRSFFSWV